MSLARSSILLYVNISTLLQGCLKGYKTQLYICKHVSFPLMLKALFIGAASLSAMCVHRTACGNVMKFGIQIEDSLNINHSKSGVSNSKTLAPATVQISTHACTFLTVRVSFFPLDPWLMPI